MGLHACREIPSHVDTDVIYMKKVDVSLQRLQFLGLHMTRAFRWCMRLKLFLKLTRAMGRGNAKFQIFRRYVAIFYTLNELLCGRTL